MKQLLILISCIGLSFLAVGQDSTFDAGNKAYADGDFDLAIEKYHQIIGTDAMSANIFYNLGNAYFQKLELGKSIWAFEKAIKIQPDHSDARFNLSFANAKTVDEIDATGSPVQAWLKINLYRFGLNFWSTISIIMSILLAVVLYFFFTTQQAKIKNLTMSSGFVVLALLVISIVLASLQKSQLMKVDSGIIITEVSTVKTSPNSEAETAFELHDGSKVKILRRDNGWTEIDVNGNVGWIDKAELWEI